LPLAPSCLVFHAQSPGNHVGVPRGNAVNSLSTFRRHSLATAQKWGRHEDRLFPKANSFALEMLTTSRYARKRPAGSDHRDRRGRNEHQASPPTWAANAVRLTLRRRAHGEPDACSLHNAPELAGSDKQTAEGGARKPCVPLPGLRILFGWRRGTDSRRAAANLSLGLPQAGGSAGLCQGVRMRRGARRRR
jgi:hypothetical protein